MRELSEFSKKTPSSSTEIEIEMLCSHCLKDINKAYFSRKDKLLTAYCEDGHETKIEGFNFI